MARCKHGYGGDGRCPDCDAERIAELEARVKELEAKVMAEAMLRKGGA